MAKVIIFGSGSLAELAHFYLTNDSEHEVVAFCDFKKLINSVKKFKDIPIISFDKVEEEYSPKDYYFFAPINSEKMNTVKEEIYNLIKNKGYKMISYISSKTINYSSKIGENCFIQAGNVIHPFTEIGNNVTLWSSNLVAHKGIIKDHVTFASHVAMAAECVIGENSYLGTNSTIRDGITIAKGTLIGLATVISKNTEEWSVYMGNPARKIGNNISKSILKI